MSTLTTGVRTGTARGPRPGSPASVGHSGAGGGRGGGGREDACSPRNTADTVGNPLSTTPNEGFDPVDRMVLSREFPGVLPGSVVGGIKTTVYQVSRGPRGSSPGNGSGTWCRDSVPVPGSSVAVQVGGHRRLVHWEPGQLLPRWLRDLHRVSGVLFLSTLDGGPGDSVVVPGGCLEFSRSCTSFVCLVGSRSSSRRFWGHTLPELLDRHVCVGALI